MVEVSTSHFERQMIFRRNSSRILLLMLGVTLIACGGPKLERVGRR